jgi:hydroxyethylthiazole kinase-like uncharacterized protein yjeF
VIMFVVTAEEMRQMDRRTIEDLGIPGAVLMENAGRGAICALWHRFPDLGSRRVAVVCGRGNNGGDGFVIARYLASRGGDVHVYLAASRGQVTGDARIPMEVLGRMGVPIREVGTEDALAPSDIPWDSYGLIVDAILGTGIRSEVEGLFRELIEAMNRSQVPILAVDIPSGLSADTGRPLGVAVEATLTVTFGLPKLGHFLYPGRRLCGELWVVDIGIPREVVEGSSPSCRVIVPEDLRGLISARPPDAHKGHFGHLMVVAGSAGKTGAAVMASEAALRVGAGLVTLGLPRSLNLAMEARLTEVMTMPLPETGWHSISLDAWDEIASASQGMSCMAVGPGLSTKGETPDLVRRIVSSVALPMVIDADGLNALAGHLEALRGAPAPRVLTPHPGEMARLLGRSVREVQEQRIGSARILARETGAWVALKGAGTVLADPSGMVELVPTGNPAMASAGMGDILTGIVGGLLAQGLGPLAAMRLGAFLHGLIADEWVEKNGGRGLMATDLLAAIPNALERTIRGEIPRPWPKRTPGCWFHV